jgi:hypothetical protein
MARLDIDFVLLDESVVMHGFRALMSGADLASFIANPVLLIQHNRPKEYVGKSEIMLPIGMWYDIRIEGDKLLAKPDFDDDDEMAVRVQKKVQKSYMKGASVWIEPLAVSEELKDLLPGQTLPTFTKWGLLEASIVDIPNCRNSLAVRNSAGKRIALDANTDEPDLKEYLNTFKKIDKPHNMDKKAICAKLGLDENAADTVVLEKLSGIISASTSVTTLNTENTALKDQIVTLKLEATTGKINALVDGAIEAKKLAAGDREKYVKLATADFTTTKELIDSITPYESIQTKLSGAAPTATSQIELDELMKLSGTELYRQDKLGKLEKLSVDHFYVKYEEAFNIKHPNAPKK